MQRLLIFQVMLIGQTASYFNCNFSSFLITPSHSNHAQIAHSLQTGKKGAFVMVYTTVTTQFVIFKDRDVFGIILGQLQTAAK